MKYSKILLLLLILSYKCGAAAYGGPYGDNPYGAVADRAEAYGAPGTMMPRPVAASAGAYGAEAYGAGGVTPHRVAAGAGAYGAAAPASELQRASRRAGASASAAEPSAEALSATSGIGSGRGSTAMFALKRLCYVERLTREEIVDAEKKLRSATGKAKILFDLPDYIGQVKTHEQLLKVLEFLDIVNPDIKEQKFDKSKYARVLATAQLRLPDDRAKFAALISATETGIMPQILYRALYLSRSRAPDMLPLERLKELYDTIFEALQEI